MEAFLKLLNGRRVRALQFFVFTRAETLLCARSSGDFRYYRQERESQWRVLDIYGKDFIEL